MTQTQTLAVVWVQFQHVGFHHWPDAPQKRAYLRNSHRHVFHVEASVQVEHDERDIEFHDLRDAAKTQFRGLTVAKGDDFGPQSCETLARRLAARLVDLYALPVSVTVSEDGECGATVEGAPQ